MNNLEKFTTRSNKLKVHRANLQRISYPVRFSTDVLFSSLVSFAFCLLFGFGFVSMKLKIYILIHTRLCKQESDKNFFTQLIFRKKTSFFWSNYETIKIIQVFIFVGYFGHVYSIVLYTWYTVLYEKTHFLVLNWLFKPFFAYFIEPYHACNIVYYTSRIFWRIWGSQKTVVIGSWW